MRKTLLGLFAIVLLVFNLSFERNGHDKDPLSLQNVKLMQANAVEATCDGSHSQECKIIGEGGMVGQGTGNLLVKY